MKSPGLPTPTLVLNRLITAAMERFISSGLFIEFHPDFLEIRAVLGNAHHYIRQSDIRELHARDSILAVSKAAIIQ